MRERSGTRDKTLNELQLRSDDLTVKDNRRLFSACFVVLFIFQVVQHLRGVTGRLPSLEAAQPCSDVFEARSQGWNRRGHALVKADEEEPSLRSCKRVQRWSQKVIR